MTSNLQETSNKNKSGHFRKLTEAKRQTILTYSKYSKKTNNNKNCQSSVLYSSKLSFKNEGEINT